MQSKELEEARHAVASVRRAYPVRLYQAYSASHGGNYAASVAFTMFVSMFPLILGLLAILGFVIEDAGNRVRMEGPILDFFPADSRAALHSTLDGVQQHPGVFGLIGLLGLLWSGSSLFASMEFALDEIHHVPERGFVGQRLMALGMTGIFVVAIVGSVGLTSIMAVASGLPFFGPLAGAAVWVGFMVTIYRVVPNRRFGMAHVWRGALIAGILMEVLTLAWPLYTSLSHGFNTYGATFALFFLLASWLYFLSQLILLGAVANRMALDTGPDGRADAAPEHTAATPEVEAAAPEGEVEVRGQPRSRVQMPYRWQQDAREADRRPT